jgi:hypothetical protein
MVFRLVTVALIKATSPAAMLLGDTLAVAVTLAGAVIENSATWLFQLYRLPQPGPKMPNSTV